MNIETLENLLRKHHPKKEVFVTVSDSDIPSFKIDDVEDLDEAVFIYISEIKDSDDGK